MYLETVGLGFGLHWLEAAVQLVRRVRHGLEIEVARRRGRARSRSRLQSVGTHFQMAPSRKVSQSEMRVDAKSDIEAVLRPRPGPRGRLGRPRNAQNRVRSHDPSVFATLDRLLGRGRAEGRRGVASRSRVRRRFGRRRLRVVHVRNSRLLPIERGRLQGQVRVGRRHLRKESRRKATER